MMAMSKQHLLFSDITCSMYELLVWQNMTCRARNYFEYTLLYNSVEQHLEKDYFGVRIKVYSNLDGYIPALWRNC
jgi:hypothetical protein